MQHHFIIAKLKNKVVDLEYCAMQFMGENILEKALVIDRHEILSEIMGLEYNAASQSGSIEK